MPEYPVPGVFVEEMHHGPGPIGPAGTSTTAFIGPTRKGPLQVPTLVGSFSDYRATFGAASAESLVSIAVLHYFSNGGRTALVVSTAAAGKRDGDRIAAADLVGRANDETGIHALENAPAGQPSANILVLPDTAFMAPREHASAIKSALAFCERHRIFFIIDPPAARASRRVLDKVLDWAKRSDWARHPNAAVYFPRLSVPDPSGKSGAMLVPASGAVAGIFSRTDQRRGVWKAPAGTDARLLGVNDIEIELTTAQMQKLQSASINGIRPYPNRGLLTWGARTFIANAADSEWKYVNVRRLMLFIEESLYGGLHWSVFEPNGDSLWARIRLAVSSFMNHLWRSGALQGHSSREAYFVKCDREIMSEADRDEGRVVALVGFAPLKPAEFIILRIGLLTADAG